MRASLLVRERKQWTLISSDFNLIRTLVFPRGCQITFSDAQAETGDGSGGQFDDDFRAAHRPVDAPGTHVFDEAQGVSVLIQKKQVERESHGEGVDGIAG